MFDPATLVSAFRNAGLSGGDTVLVHSALRSLGPVQGGADAVIDALREVVGPDGTIAVPTHTWSTVHRQQPVFHETLTPSTVGVLTNVFRAREGAVRSLHPTHSVAAMGARASELVAGHEKDVTPCPPRSPYARVMGWGGKVLLIGTGLERCTLFHCVEEIAGCGSWMLTEEREELHVITKSGTEITVPSRRHQNTVSDNYPRLEGYLVSAGLLSITKLGACRIYCLCARGAGDWLAERLRQDTRWLW